MCPTFQTKIPELFCSFVLPYDAADDLAALSRAYLLPSFPYYYHPNLYSSVK